MYSHLHRATHFVQRHGALNVVATVFNPMRFVSRYTHATEFVQRAVAAGADVSLAECAFGDRPFELADSEAQQTIRYRSRDELWAKESMINAAVTKLPTDWQYVAWIDADVSFVNPNWVQETVQQLQHYAVVQMFHSAVDLTPDMRPMRSFKGFPASVMEDGWQDRTPGEYYYDKAGLFHPGYAWACRRDAWDAMGGLLDFNVVGGGDRQMAFGLYGRMHDALFDGASESYAAKVLAWQQHAAELKQNVGYVPGTVLHYWHGNKAKRRYFDRWQVLRDNNFDPVTDLRKDWQGLWCLAGNKIKLRDDLRSYFRARQEDSIDVL